MTQWPFGDLAPFSYDVIVADPPWTFKLRSVVGNHKSPAAHYDLMTLGDIMALPVGTLAGRNCLLLIWTCGWAMATGQAQDVARAWGAKPTTELVWIKRTPSGKTRMGPGYRARTQHEPILLATFGDPPRDAIPSVIYGLAHEHSRKLTEFYETVTRHTPGARRADLFSRETRPGFDGWGNEHGKFDHPRAATDVPPGQRADDSSTARDGERQGFCNGDRAADCYIECNSDDGRCNRLL